MKVCIGYASQISMVQFRTFATNTCKSYAEHKYNLCCLNFVCSKNVTYEIVACNWVFAETSQAKGSKWAGWFEDSVYKWKERYVKLSHYDSYFFLVLPPACIVAISSKLDNQYLLSLLNANMCHGKDSDLMWIVVLCW